jgi:hypothetical protein
MKDRIEVAAFSLALTLSLFFSSQTVARAQDAVPMEILSRTLMIRAGNEQATAFEIDYQGKLYLITARHVVAGLPTDNLKIQIRKDGAWSDYQTIKTLFPSSNEVDMDVFRGRTG